MLPIQRCWAEWVSCPVPAWFMDLQSGKRSKVRSSLNFSHLQRSEPGLYRKFECQAPVIFIWLKLGLLKLWIFSCQGFTLRHGFGMKKVISLCVQVILWFASVIINAPPGWFSAANWIISQMFHILFHSFCVFVEVSDSAWWQMPSLCLGLSTCVCNNVVVLIVNHLRLSPGSSQHNHNEVRLVSWEKWAHVSKTLETICPRLDKMR